MDTNNTHHEGETTNAIENETAKIPSGVYLGAAAASITVSVIFKIMGKKNEALFVGQWVAPFLLLGIYNKIVKTQGSE